MPRLIMKPIDLAEVEKSYRIEEDGAIWSYRRNRYLKPFRNSVGYYYVYIATAGLGVMSVHRLVAAKYIGPCPRGLETSHKDGNQTNNHWTNLEYISHADNVKKSYREHGRRITYGMRGHIHSWEAKQVMALKKEKAVMSDDGRRWDSIQKCADDLRVNRRTIYRSITLYMRVRGVHIKFCSLASTKQ